MINNGIGIQNTLLLYMCFVDRKYETMISLKIFRTALSTYST